MNTDDNHLDSINCDDDDEYRIFCDICDKRAIERYYKNHPHSGTHINSVHTKQPLIITN